MDQPKVFLYALSTCGHCRNAKKLLDAHNVKYDFVDVDLLPRDEMSKTIEEVRKINPQVAFPTVDHRRQGHRRLPRSRDPGGVGAVSAADELYERLKKVNEPKGYYFNKNRELTMGLLEGLLTNKERYGYMCCPCRLASGTARPTGTSSARATTASRT